MLNRDEPPPAEWWDSKLVEVPMLKLRMGYWCFHRQLELMKKDGTARSWLIKYLDNCPLPIMLGDPGTWDSLTEAAAQKLELLQGPYGDIIARAFMVKHGGD